MPRRLRKQAMSEPELHLVDERMVGRKSVAPAEAAALPLTSLTAW